MEEQIKQIVRQELSQSKQGNQFNVSQTSFHTHNGIDSQKIKQSNIIPSTTSVAHLLTQTSETFTIDTLQNITQLRLDGIASNGLGQKASINGSAQLGNCFLYSPTTVSVSELTTQGGSFEPFLQTFNEIYIDTTDLTNTRILASEGYIAAVADQNYTNTALPPNIATLEIIKWTGSSITFKSTLATNWFINFFLSMS